MGAHAATRCYERRNSVVFRKTKEKFGGLSNMAPGFPIRINGIDIRTSEALYQACRFPHMPDVQRMIIAERSPMTAKMKSKPYRDQSRQDWYAVRVSIMRWSLRVKLASNWTKFRDLLLATGDSPIVEDSRKDAFWGAKANGGDMLVGANVLGRLLMKLRQELRQASGYDEFRHVDPLEIGDFLLNGEPIRAVCAEDAGMEDLFATTSHYSKTYRIAPTRVATTLEVKDGAGDTEIEKLEK